MKELTDIELHISVYNYPADDMGNCIDYKYDDEYRICGSVKFQREVADREGQNHQSAVDKVAGLDSADGMETHQESRVEGLQ